MDRKVLCEGVLLLRKIVALRKESVDRKDVLAVSAVLELIVALRKESVDRKSRPLRGNLDTEVALRKESVDRKNFGLPCILSYSGRSPQGERG